MAGQQSDSTFSFSTEDKEKNVDERVKGDSRAEEDEEENSITVHPGFLPNDVVLIVDEQRLYVNKELLESASPVFAAWLKKEWQSDKDTEKIKPELSFHGKTLGEMTTFLMCLLPPFPDKVTDKTVDTVLPLADEYQTESLLSECMAAICDNVKTVYKTNTYIPPSRLVTYLYWIDKYKLDAIKDDVVRLAAALKSEELQAVPDYDKVGLPLQLEVSNVRATHLASLFVSNPVDAEKKIILGKGVPLHMDYFPEWKQITLQIVENKLNQFENKPIQFDRPVKTHAFGSVHYAPRGLSWSQPSFETEKEKEITAEFFACMSVSHTFGFSGLYVKCVRLLSTQKISKENFKTDWINHYGTDFDQSILQQHLLKMCTCK